MIKTFIKKLLGNSILSSFLVQGLPECKTALFPKVIGGNEGYTCFP
jgi:hypothetical protein